MLPFYAPLERLPLTTSSSSGATIVANFWSIFILSFGFGFGFYPVFLLQKQCILIIKKCKNNEDCELAWLLHALLHHQYVKVSPPRLGLTWWPLTKSMFVNFPSANYFFLCHFEWPCMSHVLQLSELEYGLGRPVHASIFCCRLYFHLTSVSYIQFTV